MSYSKPLWKTPIMHCFYVRCVNKSFLMQCLCRTLKSMTLRASQKNIFCNYLACNSCSHIIAERSSIDSISQNDTVNIPIRLSPVWHEPALSSRRWLTRSFKLNSPWSHHQEACYETRNDHYIWYQSEFLSTLRGEYVGRGQPRDKRREGEERPEQEITRKINVTWTRAVLIGLKAHGFQYIICTNRGETKFEKAKVGKEGKIMLMAICQDCGTFWWNVIAVNNKAECAGIGWEGGSNGHQKVIGMR